MEGSDLLSDTFEVLSSREIKLLAMRSKPDKDLLMEEDDMALANVVMQEAQKKLISQVSMLFFKQASSHPGAPHLPPEQCRSTSDPGFIFASGLHSQPGGDCPHVCLQL